MFGTTLGNGATLTSRYEPNQHTVQFNPKLGMKIKSSGKIESAAIIAAHEIVHAYQADTHTVAGFNKLFHIYVRAANGKLMPLTKDNAGEEGATRIEQQIARQLEAPVRKSYTDIDKRFVRTCNVTSSKVCPD
ncbi:MAG: hypothetical protein ACRDFB_03095 [Rhabdochlamydiaceae bacterium]